MDRVMDEDHVIIEEDDVETPLISDNLAQQINSNH